jgi:hypothetical protein
MGKIKLVSDKTLSSSFYLGKVKHLFHNGEGETDAIEYVCLMNRILYTKILDELQFRNVLYNHYYTNPDDQYALDVSENRDRFRQISFQRYRLIDCNLKFNVTTDLFYDGVDIRSFRRYCPTLDINDWKAHLISLGFKFKLDTSRSASASIAGTYEKTELLKLLFRIDIEHNDFIRKYYKGNLQSLYNLRFDYSGNDNTTNLYKLIMLPDLEFEEVMSIEGYESVLNFFRENEMVYLSEFTLDFISKLLRAPKIGSVKIDHVFRKLLHLGPEHTIYAGKELNRFLAEHIELAHQITESDIVFFAKQHYINPIYPNDEFKKARVDAFLEIYRQSNGHPDPRELVNFFNYIYASTFLPQRYSVSKLNSVLLGNLDGEEVSLYSSIFSLPVFVNFSSTIKSYAQPELPSMSFNEFLGLLSNYLNEHERFVLISRNAHKRTLADTAKAITNEGLTRERVRQIERAALSKSENYIRKFKQQLKQQLKALFENRIVIMKSDFLTHLLSEYIDLFLSVDFKKIGLYYSAVIGAYYLGKNQVDDFIDELIKSNVTDIQEIISSINDVFDIDFRSVLTQKMIIDRANELGYYSRLLGYLQYKPTKGQRTAAVVKLFKEGVSLRDPSESFFKAYNEAFPDDVIKPTELEFRSIDARLMDMDEVLSTGTYEYIHIENYPIDDEKENIIGGILERALSQADSVTAAMILRDYSDQLMKCGVRSKHELYSLVKHLFGDKYHYGKANTMTIATSETSKNKGNDIRVIELIRNNDGRMTLNEISEQLGIFPANVEQLTLKSDGVILVGSNVFAIQDQDQFKLIMQRLEKFIDEKFSRQKIVSCNSLLIELMGISEFHEILTKFEINEGMSLKQLVTKFTKYKSQRASILLYIDTYGYSNIIDYFRENFVVISRSLILSTIQDLAYSPQMISRIVDDIRNSKYFIRISSDEFAVADKLSITSDVIKAVCDLVESNLGEAQYLVPRNIKNIRSQLPNLEISWTYYLVSDIARRNGYMLVEKRYRNLWQDPIILTKKPELSEFVSLVHDICLRNHYGQMHIADVLKELVGLGIINSTTDAFPTELLESGRFEIDEYDRLIIMEANV